MARTKGSKDIVGWTGHALVRDLAPGAESVEELGGKYDLPPDTIHHFKMRKKPQIAAVLADWSNEFSDLWRVKKHNRVAELEWLADEQVARLRELKEDAAAATETIRRVDATAAPVRAPLRDWNACTRQLARLEQQIAHEMGQDAVHIDAIARDQNALFRLRQLGLIPTERLKKQARELRGEPPEPSREEREREHREESRVRTEAMMQQLMAFPSS